MSYVNTVTGEYPVLLRTVRAHFPNTTFNPSRPPAPFAFVHPTEKLEPKVGFTVQRGAPEERDDKWFETWEYVPLSIERQRAAFKESREQAVKNIKVTTSLGNTFDGDETSQNRMARTAVAMRPGEMIPWVLSNNVPAMVSREELSEALRLAGEAQSALWMMPEQGGESV